MAMTIVALGIFRWISRRSGHRTGTMEPEAYLSGGGALSAVGVASWSGWGDMHAFLSAPEMLSRFFGAAFDGCTHSLSAAAGGVAKALSRTASLMAFSAEGTGGLVISKIEGAGAD
jgi:hypothetical protein